MVLGAMAEPNAILVAFGADPTSSATISFASNTSAAAFVTVSPGVGRVPAPGYDNTFANSAGLAVVYRAPLAGLLPATTYTYTCTVGGATSAARTFTTLSADPADVPIVMYWGDLGRDGGGQAFPALEAEAARTARREPGSASVAIQAGDFACACPSGGLRARVLLHGRATLHARTHPAGAARARFCTAAPLYTHARTHTDTTLQMTWGTSMARAGRPSWSASLTSAPFSPLLF